MRPVAGDLATGTPAGGLWTWAGHNPRYAYPVRVPVPRLDLAGRQMDVEHAHQLVVEGQLVPIARDLDRIERVVRGLQESQARCQHRDSGQSKSKKSLRSHCSS
jgi:hypothetical protein